MPIIEPPISDDDTKPRPSITPPTIPPLQPSPQPYEGSAYDIPDLPGTLPEPDAPPESFAAHEPLAPIEPFVRVAPQASSEPNDEVQIEPRRGCGNRLMVGLVLVALLLMCVTMVGLAGVAGYRDGVNDAATYAINTQIGAVSTQIPHITQDVQDGRWRRWANVLPRPNCG